MYIGGIDIGGTKVICAVADVNKKILSKVTFESQKDKPETFFQKCIDKLAECCDNINIEIKNLYGIGVTLPGMVDNNGVLLFAPFLGWHNVDAKAILQRLSGIDNIKCDCDVNACALAEAKAADCGSLLWLTVSTGIGGAFIEDNQIFKGYNFIAGEIGHTKVEYDKPRVCSCGQYGCAEAHASGTAVGKMVKEACENDSSFNAAFESHNLSKDAKGCAALARMGNEKALEIFDTAGDYLGRAVANAVNIINPSAVYIGGGMGANSFDLLSGAIRKRLLSDAVEFSKDIPVYPSKLGYEAALIGALSLI